MILHKKKLRERTCAGPPCGTYFLPLPQEDTIPAQIQRCANRVSNTQQLRRVRVGSIYIFTRALSIYVRRDVRTRQSRSTYVNRGRASPGAAASVPAAGGQPPGRAGLTPLPEGSPRADPA